MFSLLADIKNICDFIKRNNVFDYDWSVNIIIYKINGPVGIRTRVQGSGGPSDIQATLLVLVVTIVEDFYT